MIGHVTTNSTWFMATCLMFPEVRRMWMFRAFPHTYFSSIEVE